MRKVVLLGFLLLLAIDTSSNVLVKLAANVVGEVATEPDAILAWLRRVVREPLVLAVIACYVAAFLTYTSLLKHAPVGPAYAAVHGHVVTVLIVSMLWLGERLTLVQGLGCALVVAGIAVLGVTETMESDKERPEHAPPDGAHSELAPRAADPLTAKAHLDAGGIGAAAPAAITERSARRATPKA
jgi:multidrug transporter EmrE-like cation transporter